MSENPWENVSFRNLDKINALLDAGADINFRDRRCLDQTLLHISIRPERSELAALLIRRGADVNAADRYGDTPLYAAIRCRNVELAQKLIDAGAIIDRLQRFSPLHMAVFEHHQAMIDLLLDAGASIDFLQHGETAAEYAASHGKQLLVKHFVQRGAKQSLHVAAAMGDIAAIQQHIAQQGDIDARMGTTPRYGAPPLLYIAAVNNQLAIAELLLKHGADPNIECCQDDCALLAACSRGFVEMAKLLINGGVNIHQTCLAGGILVNIAAGGAVELAKLLLDEYGISIHSDQGNQGNTPVVAAAGNGHLPMLKFLLAQGLTVHQNAVQSAAVHGHGEIVRFLVQNSGDPNGAIFEAAMKGDGEMLQFLVQNGADPNFRIFSGETALDRLVSDGDRAKAEILLSVGADVNAGIATGKWTALHHAAWSANLAMVKFLVAAGADVNATDENGETPLMLNATRRRSDNVIDFLLANGAKG
jgi:ankyrin repeat protein